MLLDDPTRSTKHSPTPPKANKTNKTKPNQKTQKSNPPPQKNPIKTKQ